MITKKPAEKKSYINLEIKKPYEGMISERLKAVREEERKARALEFMGKIRGDLEIARKLMFLKRFVPDAEKEIRMHLPEWAEFCSRDRINEIVDNALYNCRQMKMIPKEEMKRFEERLERGVYRKRRKASK